jgi:quercetin dioxygenase-like cupin family protein
MITTKALVSAVVVVAAVGATLLLEHSAHASGEVTSEQLLVADLAGEPDKEVNIQPFPPGASVPWYIHPGAHEFDYQLEGALTLQRDGEPTEVITRGEAIYVAPDVVHRGLNVSRTQSAKILAVRVKPKDKPLTTEVQP